MKLLLLIVLLFAVSCATTVPNTTTGSTFHLHDYKVETLDNGLQMIYVEDHSLPSVSLAVLVKDGSASDPMAKSGLSELMANVWARGSARMNASQIADELGQLGTELNHDVSQDYTWFQVSGLTQHGEKLLDIFSDVILHPRFEQQELDRERGIILSAIQQRSDHPDQFAAEAFGAYLFGGHPYARPVSGLEADIKTINRVDLFRAYKRAVKPNNAVLVLAGDMDPAFLAHIKGRFLAWNKQDVPHKTFPLPPQFKGVNIRLIDKPDLTQSQIIIGQFGIKRSDPDYLLLRVANVILGGNFSSRLMDRVRVKLGLTYGISSSFDAQLDRGPFAISTFTKNQSVGNTISESMKVFKQFYADGVTEKEVEDAKNYLMGAFPRAIETPERLGFNLALLRLYGISDDYLKNFVVNVAQITPDQVNGAIKAHLDPDDMKIVVLSKAQDSVEQIRPLGLLEVKKFNEVF